MITTVTLNPAIDRAYVINDFKPNKKYHLDVDEVNERSVI